MSSKVDKQIQVIAGATAFLLICGSVFLLWRAKSAVFSLPNSSKRGEGAWKVISQENLADVIDDARLLGEVRYRDS